MRHASTLLVVLALAVSGCASTESVDRLVRVNSLPLVAARTSDAIDALSTSRRVADESLQESLVELRAIEDAADELLDPDTLDTQLDAIGELQELLGDFDVEKARAAQADLAAQADFARADVAVLSFELGASTDPAGSALLAAQNQDAYAQAVRDLAEANDALAQMAGLAAADVAPFVDAAADYRSDRGLARDATEAVSILQVRLRDEIAAMNAGRVLVDRFAARRADAAQAVANATDASTLPLGNA